MAYSNGYLTEIVSTGTEKEFMTSVINAITGLSTAITCTGSVDQYDGESSTVPEFIFAFNGKNMLKIKRGAAIGTATKYLNISIFVDSNIIANNNSYIYNYTSSIASASNERKAIISWLVSDDFILLVLTGGYGDFGYYTNLGLINAKNGSNVYGGGYDRSSNGMFSRNQIFNIYKNPGNTDYILRAFDSGVTGTFATRFGFKSKPGQIDYVKSAAYVNSGVKVFDIPYVCDCTAVTLGDTVSLKDGSYLAVGPNQLVRVS